MKRKELQKVSATVPLPERAVISADGRHPHGRATVLPAVMLVLFFFPVVLIRAADKAVRNF